MSEIRHNLPSAVIVVAIACCLGVLACYWLSVISFRATALMTLVIVAVCRRVAHRLAPHKFSSFNLMTGMYAGALYFCVGAIAWIIRPAWESGGRIVIPVVYLATAAYAFVVGNKLAKRAGQS